MKLSIRSMSLPGSYYHDISLKLLEELVKGQLGDNLTPVRFSIREKHGDHLIADVCVIESGHPTNVRSIFDFKRRPFERSENFTAVAIIPTGISASVGGDSGDGQAAMRLLSSSCDRLILHPNSVNGADIAEITDNMLYVEGSTLTRLMMGAIGLLPSRGNRILLLVDRLLVKDKGYEDLAVNAASAARLGLGAKIDVAFIDKPPRAEAYVNENGVALGTIDNISGWHNVIGKYINDYDAFAVHSIIDVEKEKAKTYFMGEKLTNPWGGIEAMMTHSLSLLNNKPIAHAPLPNSNEFSDVSMMCGVVNPLKASEVVSKVFLHCVLKGLHKSPAIITDDQHVYMDGCINACDVNCLVIPDRCVGLPVLAALKQNIKVIAVADGDNTMKNDLNDLPWKQGQFFRARNYVEAAGLISALKMGIDPTTLERPIARTYIVE